MTRTRVPLAVRFEEKYVPDPLTGCWLWLGAYMQNGRPVIRAPGKRGGNLIAYRVSWELHRGPIPEGLNVCHRCDTPACVNPDHLFIGTHIDNANDMWSKGRGVVPPRHHRGRHRKDCSNVGGDCACYARSLTG